MNTFVLMTKYGFGALSFLYVLLWITAIFIHQENVELSNRLDQLEERLAVVDDADMPICVDVD